MDGSERIEKWLDCLESSLETEADQAGLLEHSSMIRAGRELIVRREFNRFCRQLFTSPLAKSEMCKVRRPGR